MDEIRLDKRSHGPEFEQEDEVVLWAHDDGTVRVTDEDGGETTLGSGGGSVPGSVRLLGPVTINWDTPNIGTTGVELLSLEAGDALIMAWYDVTVKWADSNGDYPGDPFLNLITDGTDNDLFAGTSGPDGTISDDPGIPVEAGDHLLERANTRGKVALRSGTSGNTGNQIPAIATDACTIMAQIDYSSTVGVAQGQLLFYAMVATPVAP